MLDNLNNLIKEITTLIIVLVPTIILCMQKINNAIKENKLKIKKKNKEQALKKLDEWEHAESQKIIIKIKNLCNYYKDIGQADTVQYWQLENGTYSANKLCNMYISCLAEDNRYSKLKKIIRFCQRVPYSEFAEVAQGIKENEDIDYYEVSDLTKDGTFINNMINDKYASSSISSVVTNENNMIVGCCAFLYSDINFNNAKHDEQIKQLIEFKNSIKNLFIQYNFDKEEKKKELGL